MNSQIKKDEFTINTILDKKASQSLQILNEIDFLIANAATIPLTSKVMVDAEYLYSLSEQFRKVFPLELKQADIVIREVQDIVDDAEAKAELVLAEAQAKAQSLVNDSLIVQEAQVKAQSLLSEAMYGREQMKKEAEEYVKNMFSLAEHRLMDTMKAISEAKSTLHE